MPRDSRLYMTFPIDIHRHPKFKRLTVGAKWTFVEMNGEARIEENDGIFTHEEAEFMWSVKHLNELVKSHPSRPLVVKTADSYVIRDYAEHQLTRADREDLSAKRSAAGKASAEARANKSSASVEQVLNKVQQTPTGTEIGTGTGTGTEEPSYVIETKRVSSSDEHDHGTLIPDNWQPNQQHIDKATSLHLDIHREHQRFRSHAQTKQRRMKNWNAAFTNWLKQGAVMAQQHQRQPPANQPRMSKAAQNAEAYRKEFGADDTQGSLAAPHYRISP